MITKIIGGNDKFVYMIEGALYTIGIQVIGDKYGVSIDRATVSDAVHINEVFEVSNKYDAGYYTISGSIMTASKPTSRFMPRHRYEVSK